MYPDTLTPMLDFNANLTGNFQHIYIFGTQGFYDYLQYLFELVYNRAITSTVLNWSVAIFIFMLFLTL